jgi:hypothetical protein
VLARESGETYKDIAAAAGISSERARQVCNEEGVENGGI